MAKQTIQIEISRDYGSTEIRIPWLTKQIAEALETSSNIKRIEIKNVKPKTR